MAQRAIAICEGDTSMNDASGLQPETLTANRRTIIKGMAWSVPTIAAAVVAPAYAASTDPQIKPETGDYITDWKGDHHYGSNNKNEERRAYDFPIDVTDAYGNPLPGVTVTVEASGTNRDGDLLAVYEYPQEKDKGPEDVPHPVATSVTDANGRAMFAVSTQNLSSGERPARAKLTITITVNGVTVTKVVDVYMTESD